MLWTCDLAFLFNMHHLTTHSTPIHPSAPGVRVVFQRWSTLHAGREECQGWRSDLKTLASQIDIRQGKQSHMEMHGTKSGYGCWYYNLWVLPYIHISFSCKIGSLRQKRKPGVFLLETTASKVENMKCLFLWVSPHWLQIYSWIKAKLNLQIFWRLVL